MKEEWIVLYQGGDKGKAFVILFTDLKDAEAFCGDRDGTRFLLTGADWDALSQKITELRS